MAREEIKLVGSFDDQITKKLQKLNKEIANMSRSFERFNKKLAPVTKSFAKMAMSAKEFSNAMNSQRGSIEGSARAMREYSRQAGKMTSAMRKISAEREKTRRAQGMSRAEARKQGSGAGPTGPMPAPTKSPKGGAAKVGAIAGQSFMKNVGSTAIGMTIANAFAGGVAKAKNLIMAPFTKFQAAFGERMNDEMDDIKSAGGLFALDMDLTQKSGNERLFNNFNEALRYQEEINTRMAQSASNLPGTTSEFVDMNRRMTDTLQMVMENNREEFVKLGESQGADVSMGGTDAAKEALAQVGQNLTESLMLASAGQQGGLPMDLAIQQLMNMEQGKIKMQSFTNKFRAAFQKNPLLKNFLMRAEEELNATAAGSAKRLEIIADVYDRAIPEQQIDKMRGSLKGLMESVRSGLLDPQGGLFGLSRAVQDFDSEGNVIGPIMKKNVNNLGEVLYKVSEDLFDKDGAAILDKNGKAVKKGTEFTAAELAQLGEKMGDLAPIINKATGEVTMGGKSIGSVSQSTTYLFEQIREILANYGSVLTQFVGLLPTIFDPFSKMTGALNDMRMMSVEFFRVFQTTNKQLYAHVDALKASSDSATKGLGTRLGKQTMQRGALFTLADFLAGTGAMDAKRAKELKEQFVGAKSMTAAGVEGFDQVAASAFKEMFSSLMNSDMMHEFGKMGGIIVGGITQTVVELIQRLTGFAKGKGANKLIEGFSEGVREAFGDMSFGDVKTIIGDALGSVLIKSLDVLFTQILPPVIETYIGTLFDQFFKSLLSGNLVGILLSGLGIAKIVGVIGTILGAVGTVWGAITAAFTVLTGVVSFVTANFAILSGILGTVVMAIVMPILAVAGAIMIVIAVVRNFGSIMKMVGGALKFIAGQIVENFSRVFGALGHFVKFIGTIAGPFGGQIRELGEGILNAGGGMKDFGQNLKKEGLKDIMDAGSEMKKQYTEDVAAIKSKFSSMFPKMDATTTSLSEMNRMINQNVDSIEAEKKARTDAKNGLTAAETKAIESTEGLDMDKYVKNKVGIDAQLAKLRGGNVHTNAHPGGESTEDLIARLRSGNVHGDGAAEAGTSNNLEAVNEAAANASETLEGISEPAKNASKTLDDTNTSAENLNKTLDELPAKVEESLVGAATNAGNAITQAAQALAQALNAAAQSIKNVGSSVKSPDLSADIGSAGAYDGHMGGRGAKTLPLAEAIAKERSMMPSGSDLMIANTSETVIPAFDGHMGDGFKGLSFAEMEGAAGFDRMKSYTEQLTEMADRTAADMASSFGGALGGGSATLNAMEALGNSMGLITTSGFRPGDPGFHGANRARDLSNGGGETPEMNKVANIMATKYGQSLTELIYTPLGYSIKNGAKTGLISPSNHYHHIHVAVAEGLAKAAVFNSQQAAEKYERKMMPSGAEPMKVNLGSMTANSSEVGGVQIGSINISGVDDPKEIAEKVADEILLAMQRSSYTELFSS